jgi:hypothetical protein
MSERQSFWNALTLALLWLTCACGIAWQVGHALHTQAHQEARTLAEHLARAMARDTQIQAARGEATLASVLASDLEDALTHTPSLGGATVRIHGAAEPLRTLGVSRTQVLASVTLATLPPVQLALHAPAYAPGFFWSQIAVLTLVMGVLTLPVALYLLSWRHREVIGIADEACLATCADIRQGRFNRLHWPAFAAVSDERLVTLASMLTRVQGQTHAAGDSPENPTNSLQRIRLACPHLTAYAIIAVTACGLGVTRGLIAFQNPTLGTLTTGAWSMLWPATALTPVLGWWVARRYLNSLPAPTALTRGLRISALSLGASIVPLMLLLALHANEQGLVTAASLGATPLSALLLLGQAWLVGATLAGCQQACDQVGPQRQDGAILLAIAIGASELLGSMLALAWSMVRPVAEVSPLWYGLPVAAVTLALSRHFLQAVMALHPWLPAPTAASVAATTGARPARGWVVMAITGWTWATVITHVAPAGSFTDPITLLSALAVATIGVGSGCALPIQPARAASTLRWAAIGAAVALTLLMGPLLFGGTGIAAPHLTDTGMMNHVIAPVALMAFISTTALRAMACTHDARPAYLALVIASIAFATHVVVMAIGTLTTSNGLALAITLLLLISVTWASLRHE